MTAVQDILLRYFSRITLAPEIIASDFTIKPGRIKAAKPECRPAARTGRVAAIDRPGILSTPVLRAEIHAVKPAPASARVRPAHIEKQKVHADVLLFQPDEAIPVISGTLATRVSHFRAGLIPYAVACRAEVERLNACAQVLKDDGIDIPEKVHELTAQQEVSSHHDIRFAYRKPFLLSSSNLRDFNKIELIYYWRMLLGKIPYGSGDDLEMLAVFQNIEKERFSSIRYDAHRNMLRMRPKSPPHQPPDKCRRYDIIYGRFKPNGAIISAVAESD